MSILDVLILGVVEGITEFLPISSTGHLILTSFLLHGQQFIDTPFVKTFNIVIQLGAILAPAALYWRRLLVDRRTLAITITAFIPTGVLGFILYRLIKRFEGNLAIDLWSLLIGGIVLLLIEWHLHNRDAPVQAGETVAGSAGRPGLRGAGTRGTGAGATVHRVDDISFAQALIIGTCQAISMIPGVSRSAATIMTGLLLRIDRRAIVEFSFVLAIPTMLAASAYDLYKNYRGMTLEQVDLLAIGFVVAFVLAILAIKFLLRFVQTHTFNAFGIYRILAAIAFWLIVLR
jgi:undecaprenyl-diphosphatase